MPRTRVIYFELDDREENMDFGTYALIMYYAKSTNYSEGKKLLDVTLSEFRYRVNYDLTTEGLSPIDEVAHFDVHEINDVLHFIENELIPQLQREPQDLLKKYINHTHFLNLFYEDMDYLEALGLGDDEIYFDSTSQLIFTLRRLMRFLQYSLAINQPCLVWIR